MPIRPIAVCLGLAVTPGLAITAHARYDVTVLQDPGGVSYSTTNAINASGQSVGVSFTTLELRDAVLWSPSGRATVLQDPGGVGASQAVAINASGQSVGVSYTTGTFVSEDAVLWSPSGKERRCFRTLAAKASTRPSPSTPPGTASGIPLPGSA